MVGLIQTPYLLQLKSPNACPENAQLRLTLLA